ncbi:MAG: class I tRNA ligase family protein [Candidatus Binatales bacterium]
MAERIHITTAIFYSNGPPHVGHASEAFAADVFARHHRRIGDIVTFVTGTDEHGDKNYRAAAAEGLKPKPFVDRIAAAFKDAFAELQISYDYFVRTTDPAHQKFVQRMLQRAHESGDIYFKDYEGLYCVGCERFYTEKELLEGGICPAHKTPVEKIKEGNYFLKLEKYRPQILKRINDDHEFIRPERYRNEALNMLAEPLEDLCISRPKSRLDWGIELPFDSKYVTYVWYDAFWAYVSELPEAGDESLDSLRKIMPVTEHFMGKDILKTHAVYWPAMLLGAGLPLYRHLNVHGWFNFGGERMSKSSGNMPDPIEYQKKYGTDVLRFFLMREITYGLDSDFTEERLIERYNADLANDLGNLTSRVLAMAARYFNGEVTESPRDRSGPFEAGFYAPLDSLAKVVDFALHALAFSHALERIWQTLDTANKYVVHTEPFKLAKDPASLPQVAQILANLLEGLRVVADVLEPFMPITSARMFEMLAVGEKAARAPFGEGIRKGHRVNPPVPLFPRIEKAK